VSIVRLIDRCLLDVWVVEIDCAGRGGIGRSVTAVADVGGMWHMWHGERYQMALITQRAESIQGLAKLISANWGTLLESS
jgi:hypothetical protein